jgi:predicted phage terminase large subunit-like protein
MADDCDLARALLRRDLASFTRMAFHTIEPGTEFRTRWFNRALWEKLRQVESGECRRLIVTVPPRSGKSTTVSVAFPAWALGRDPGRKLLCLSFGNDLARTLAVQFREVVESEWYQATFPACGIDARRQRDLEIATTGGGYRMAASLGGRYHGRGADLIIIDDPIKPGDALSDKLRTGVNERYRNSVISRLNDKTTGAIIIVMQRLHEDDLVGHVLQQGEEWDELTIPAIAPADQVYRLGPDPRDLYRRRAGEVLDPQREPRAVLDTLRRSLGSLSFSAQYQQNPLPIEGNIVKRDWIEWYDAPPEAFELVVASWDPAATEGDASDYSVGTIWGVKDGHIYLLEVLRGKYQVPDLRRLIVATHHDYKVHATLIEDSGFGTGIGQDLRRTTRVHPIMRRFRYDKQARILAQSPKFESGQVRLPREAPWLAAYLHELLGFPNAGHDDQVDSTSQALDYLAWRIGDGSPPARPNPQRPPGLPHPARPPGVRRR